MTRKSPAPEFVMGRSASKPKLVDGSKRTLCGKCRKHFVWVTPAMVLYKMTVVCERCAPRGRRPDANS